MHSHNDKNRSPREKNSSFSPIFLGMSLNSSHKEKRDLFLINKNSNILN